MGLLVIKTTIKSAKIFKNGQSQAVRLPKEFRLEGKEVYVNKISNVVILIPVQDSWDSLSDSLKLFSKDYMSQRGQPKKQQKREALWT